MTETTAMITRDRAELAKSLPLDQRPLPAHRRRAQGDDSVNGGD